MTETTARVPTLRAVRVSDPLTIRSATDCGTVPAANASPVTSAMSPLSGRMSGGSVAPASQYKNSLVTLASSEPDGAGSHGGEQKGRDSRDSSRAPFGKGSQRMCTKPPPLGKNPRRTVSTSSFTPRRSLLAKRPTKGVRHGGLR